MDIEVNGKIYHFKDKCTMLDYIATFNSKVQIGWKSQVNLLSRMSQEPEKLSTKELLLMDASIVLQMIKSVSENYGMAGDLDFLEKE